jgi:aminoglycoside N3'-acetyltransferase
MERVNKRVLWIDTRQQDKKHILKHQYFERMGYKLIRSKLYSGDYMLLGGTYSVDTKANIAEIATNIDQQHERFRQELINARDAQIKLTILIENKNKIESLEDLANWTESDAEFAKRKHAVRRLSGLRLAKAMQTMSSKYGASFMFCAPKYAGQKVLEILEGEFK